MKMENQISKIKPADRLASVSEYYFSKKLKEVARMNAEGKDVISLGIGSPDMPPSENTIQTLCDAARNPDGHGYHALCRHSRTAPQLCRLVQKMVRRGAGPQYGDTAAHRFQRRYPARHTGFRQPRRAGAGSQSRLSHLYVIEQNIGSRSHQLQPERRKRLDARLRRTGEDGYEPRQTDVDQLSQHAHRSKRNAGTLPEAGGLCTPQGHCHRQRQPVQLHPERTPPQHPQCAGRQRNAASSSTP